MSNWLKYYTLHKKLL